MNTKILHSKQIIVEGLLLQYYVSSSHKNAETILFLHGWRSFSQTWQPLLSHLPTRYRFICLDLPGFGKSQTPKQVFNLSDYANIVARFLDKLEIKDCTVIGHSFGGAIGITLASQNQKKINNLILVDASGIRQKTNKLQVIKSLAAIVRPLFNSKRLHKLKYYIYQKYGWDDYLATPQLKETYLKVINEDLTDMLHLIKVPTLLLWGDRDLDTPLSYAQIMKQEIPHSELRILEHAGHFSFLDQPKESCQFILDFISK